LTCLPSFPKPWFFLFSYQPPHWSIQERQAETPFRKFFTVLSTPWKTVRFPGGSTLNTVQNHSYHEKMQVKVKDRHQLRQNRAWRANRRDEVRTLTLTHSTCQKRDRSALM
jgi:hypothetical protein